MKEDKFYIYGRNSVTEALNSDIFIEKIYIQYNTSGESIFRIQKIANKKKIPLVQYDKHKFAELAKNVAGESAITQGVIALRSVVKYLDLEELSELAFSQDKNPVLVLLNEISDVHNLGAIARSAECMGAQGLIIPERNSSPVTPAAVKSSAGALSYIPVAKTGSVINTLIKLRDLGYWIIAADMDGDKNYFDEDFNKPVVLIIGSEGKGISPAVQKYCDIKIKIPMNGRISSLNASVSAGIILFDILRQRLKNQ